MGNVIADVGIIGVGAAGAFSAYKIAQEHKNIKCIIWDAGRPPVKRRLQTQGFLGLLPNSDGKLYMNDIASMKQLCKAKPTNTAFQWFKDNVCNALNLDVVDDANPFLSTIKKIKNNGFTISKRNHIQLIPKEIHSLSKLIAEALNGNTNITQRYDDEIADITYERKQFTITSMTGDAIICKRLILSCGRSGWRWTNKLFGEFGLTVQNDSVAQFGLRAELPAAALREYNRSNCVISNDDLEIGPLSWGGTVIPEDHGDTVISAFRSNEDRWLSDKVSFNVLGTHRFPDNVKQLDRIGQLTFILTNERVLKEKIALLLTGKAKVSILPEYGWMPEAIRKIEKFMPDIVHGSFYAPTLLPLVSKVKLTSKLQTEQKDLILAGETTGIHGLLFAMLSGVIAGDTVAA